MQAILRKQFGGPDVLEIREMPEPEPKAGHAVIQVKAFGSSANSSENQGVGFTEGAIGLSWHMLRQGAAQS
jgi:hypothetical protein